MKKIVVYIENTEPITLIDNDNLNKIEYAKKLSEVFHSDTVNILETSESILIIKSNNLKAINVIDELEDNDESKVKVEDCEIQATLE